MSKGKNIFHRKDESITSKEDIFDYLGDDQKTEKEEALKSAPSASPMRSEMDAPPNFESKKKNVLENKNSKNNHAFEKKMLSDPFLAEAVEGYSNLNNKERATSILKEINNSISPKTTSEDNRRIVMRIAALLLIMFLISGGAYYLFEGFTRKDIITAKKGNEMTNQQPSILKDNTNVAGNLNQDTTSKLALESDRKKEELKSITQKPVSTDGYVINEIQSSNNKEIVDKSDLAIQNSEMGPTNSSIERGISAPQVTEEENMRSITNTPKDISYLDDELIKENSEIQRSVSQEKVEEKTSKKKSSNASNKISKEESFDPSPIVTTSKSASLEYGIRLYNQSNYTQAKDELEGVLSTQPSNQEAIFYAGMSDYKLGNYEKSISRLKRIEKGSRHYDEARWSMALIYKVLGNKKEALSLFKVLAMPGNVYSDKANEELKNIE